MEAHPWLELLTYIKTTWPRSNYVTSTWQEVHSGFFCKRCTCHNWRYWDLPKLHDGVVIAPPMFNSVQYSLLKKLWKFHALAKIPWKNVSYHGWSTKKTLVSWIVTRTQICFKTKFSFLALLIVFHCIISLLIVFHFIALLIGFSK